MICKKILKEKRSEILEIAKNHGASNIRIFGSVARDEATANSDIDFLMDIEPGKNLLDR
ncbi:MAG: nucleotidyltransferase domain-containing protein, partial [Xenococcaceae cyanobacterium MO_234.B1]|nr:nucleotidyltransferase domain-containing protein [Xenococcaceae cyanobacterium MO_234.B1]